MTPDFVWSVLTIFSYDFTLCSSRLASQFVFYLALSFFMYRAQIADYSLLRRFHFYMSASSYDQFRSMSKHIFPLRCLLLPSCPLLFLAFTLSHPLFAQIFRYGASFGCMNFTTATVARLIYSRRL